MTGDTENDGDQNYTASCTSSKCVFAFFRTWETTRSCFLLRLFVSKFFDMYTTIASNALSAQWCWLMKWLTHDMFDQRSLRSRRMINFLVATKLPSGVAWPCLHKQWQRLKSQRGEIVVSRHLIANMLNAGEMRAARLDLTENIDLHQRQSFWSRLYEMSIFRGPKIISDHRQSAWILSEILREIWADIFLRRWGAFLILQLSESLKIHTFRHNSDLPSFAVSNTCIDRWRSDERTTSKITKILPNFFRNKNVLNYFIVKLRIASKWEKRWKSYAKQRENQNAYIKELLIQMTSSIICDKNDREKKVGKFPCFFSLRFFPLHSSYRPDIGLY